MEPDTSPTPSPDPSPSASPSASPSVSPASPVPAAGASSASLPPGPHPDDVPFPLPNLSDLVTPARTGPAVGLKEAARMCGVSPTTIRRKRDQLVEAGATASNDGWSIPIAALVQVGLLDRTSPPDPPVPGTATGAGPATSSPSRPPGHPPGHPAVSPHSAPLGTGPGVSLEAASSSAALLELVEALRSENVDLRERATRAEVQAARAGAQAVERERVIEAQQAHLRMLEAAPRPAAHPMPAPSQPAPQPDQQPPATSERQLLDQVAARPEVDPRVVTPPPGPAARPRRRWFGRSA